MINSTLFEKHAHSAMLLLCIIAVVIFKIPHLNLPFFWDEAWVYAPAVKLMGEGVPSLMPDSIPVNFTRGHPLLFHFLASSWLKIFGESNSSLHSFALLVSVFLLLAVYYFGKNIFNKDVAIAATVLLSVQSVFLAQASFLLPEILLSLFVILTIYYFLKGRKIGYVISGSALILTKEPGIILIASLSLWLIIDVLLIKKDKINWLALFKELSILSLPVLLSSIYFIVQWKKTGWFFYPEHIGMIDFSYQSFHRNFRIIYNFIFEEQGRRVLTIGFVIIFLLFYKPISFKWRVFLSFSMLSCVKIFFGAWKLPPALTLSVCGLIIILLFYFICVKKYSEKFSIAEKAICVFFIFFFLFMLFSSVNFLSNRYLLCLMPLYALAILYFVFISFSQEKWLFITISVLAIFFSAYKSADIKRSGDNDLSYINVIALQKSVIGFMEDNDLYDENIHATFLNVFEMTSPYSGLLKSEKRFTMVSDDLTDSTEYAIITNFQVDDFYDSIPKSSKFSEIKKFENERFWAKVYKKK